MDGSAELRYCLSIYSIVIKSKWFFLLSFSCIRKKKKKKKSRCVKGKTLFPMLFVFILYVGCEILLTSFILLMKACVCVTGLSNCQFMNPLFLVSHYIVFTF